MKNQSSNLSWSHMSYEVSLPKLSEPPALCGHRSADMVCEQFAKHILQRIEPYSSMLPNIAWTEPQQYSILCVFAVVLLWWCGCLATKGLHEQPREAHQSTSNARFSVQDCSAHWHKSDGKALATAADIFWMTGKSPTSLRAPTLRQQEKSLQDLIQA